VTGDLRSATRHGRADGPARRGWTTGACATAAAAAAYTAMRTGEFPDPVEIRLPGGRVAGFTLTREWLRADAAGAAVTKDAGDDPDVTHGAVVTVTVSPGLAGSGVAFRAGPGVGTVTKPGLPLPVGEPAINPVPRQMITDALSSVATACGGDCDLVVEVGVEGGAELARHTLNPRLGIVDGLSILGTTGVVVPYSCSAWIESIRRGVDVARAAGRVHVAACTGRTSEATVRTLYGLPEDALLEMGDFAGAVLKYLRRHPVPRLTIGAGIAKAAKLADGHLDLHSARSQVDLSALAALVPVPEVAARVADAGTAMQALAECQAAGVPLGDMVAERARRVAAGVLREAPVDLDVVVVDRAGAVIGRSGPVAR
jgi:cobalt-precorrin-5B (C1)-methyltransferase